MSNFELFKVTAKQKKDTIEKLIESSSPTHAFFLILILSGVIATFGVLMDSVAIVIGAMLVSPLLSPILAISMGIVMADPKLILRSVKVLIIASLLVVAIGFIFAVFDINTPLNNEILSRSRINLYYFGVAVASGIAASFAITKEEFYERMVGVAVAIALLPPLVVVGVAASFWSWHLLSGALGLFILNLFGILLGSLIVFSLLRFYPEKKVVEKELKEEEKHFENLNNQ